MKCRSVNLALLAGTLVAAGVAVSLRQSSAQPPQSSKQSSVVAAHSQANSPRLFPHPWAREEVSRSLGQWYDRSRRCLADSQVEHCSKVSLEVMVRLARVYFVRQPDEPDPFGSCLSLIRTLERHGFSVTLEPRCCSAVTSAQPRR